MIEHLEAMSFETFKNLTIEERYELYLLILNVFNAFVDGINNSGYKE